MNMANRTIFSWRQGLPLVGAVLLLCGAGIEGRAFRAPPDAAEYRSRVWAARTAVPLNIGDWKGADEPVEVEAVTLLRPYFIISRQYQNMLTGRRAGFLFVDCQDARDTISHYPPNCYRGAGWSLELAEPKDWQLPHMTVHLTEYTFTQGMFDANGQLFVDDFFVLPGAETAPNRTAVIAAARDLQRRFYGVAQVQLVYHGDSTLQERRRTFSELIGPLENLIQTVETIQPKASVPAASAEGNASAKEGNASATVRND
jgi:uncharacterized protein DUF3485